MIGPQQGCPFVDGPLWSTSETPSASSGSHPKTLHTDYDSTTSTSGRDDLGPIESHGQGGGRPALDSVSGPVKRASNGSGWGHLLRSTKYLDPE